MILGYDLRFLLVDIDIFNENKNKGWNIFIC